MTCSNLQQAAQSQLHAAQLHNQLAVVPTVTSPSSTITTTGKATGQKLRNRPLALLEYQKIENIRLARSAAQQALKHWYQEGIQQADALHPQLQINDNLAAVASIPGWMESKGRRNGYVMVCSNLDETPKPTLIKLDYNMRPSGGLSFRMLYSQIRASLKLKLGASLRMCPWRPWYRYSRETGRIPERVILPSTDGSAVYLLGTTIFYYSYVSLSSDDDPVI
jgi:hypothetical protein